MKPAAVLGAALVPLATLSLLAACSGGSDDARPEDPPTTSGSTADAEDVVEPVVLARPAALDDLPEVELLAPGAEDAGAAPTFEWSAVDGAAEYRLSVLGPERPLWAWTGDETSVALGLRAEDRSPTAPSIELEAGSWWSVAALDDQGDVIALSGLRSVSPDDSPATPTPPGGVADAREETSPTSEPSAEPADLHACDLLTREEVAAVIGPSTGDAEPLDGIVPAPGSACEWTRDDGLSVMIELYDGDAGYQPEMWVTGEPEPIDGIEEPSFFYDDGFAIKAGWIHGPRSVVVSAYTGGAEGVRSLIALVDERLGG